VKEKSNLAYVGIKVSFTTMAYDSSQTSWKCSYWRHYSINIYVECGGKFF
jgi:hypothetical protein